MNKQWAPIGAQEWHQGQPRLLGCINWDLVDGKTKTNYTWHDRWTDREPDSWFHRIFLAETTPYSDERVALFRRLSGRGSGPR